MRLSVKVSTYITLLFLLFLPLEPLAGEDDLLWSTLLGGSDYDLGYDIAVDRDGCVYLAGVVTSEDFPKKSGPADTLHGGRDILVVKLAPAGDSIAYATILGGSEDDEGHGIEVDENGYVYVAGVTDSDDFPVSLWAYDTTANGARDAVALKLDPSGTLLYYSTYLGGSGSESGRAITVDDQGRAWLTGDTESADFPTTPGALDTTYNGGHWDAYLARLSLHGDMLLYGSFLGGGETEEGRDIALDSQERVLVAGQTSSDDFPVTLGVYDYVHNGGQDAFVVKLDTSRDQLALGTYLGGSLADVASGIAVGEDDAIFVSGRTVSPDFPTTPGAFDRTQHGMYAADAFVTRFSPGAESLAFSTFLGGENIDEAHGIALTPGGEVFVAGRTHSADFPVTPGSFCPAHSGRYSDAFLTGLDPIGSQLTYGTFLGGNGIDLCWGLATDREGILYLVGETKSTDYPTTAGSFCDTLTGDYADVFVSKLRPGATPVRGGPAAAGGSFSYPLMSSWPNPFNACVRIRYRVVSLDPVAVKIFNTSGQLVRTLVDGTGDPGHHTVEWDGKNSRGDRAASGIYFCRLQNGTAQETSKLVLLR